MTDIDANLILDVPTEDDDHVAAYIVIQKWDESNIKWHLYAKYAAGCVAVYFDSVADAEKAKAMIAPVSDPEELADIDAVKFRADDARARRQK